MKGFSAVLFSLVMASTSAMASISEVFVALDDKKVALAQTLYDELSEQSRKSVDGQIAQTRLLMATEKFEDAYDTLETLAEEHENNVSVQYYFGLSAMKMAQIASIFSKLGYAEDGLEALEKAIALDPNHEQALEVLIGFHLAAPGIAGGDKKAALEYANQVKTLNERSGYIQLARALQGLEQYEQSLKALDEGIEKYDDFGELYYHRAVMHINDESWNEAYQDLTNAIKLAQTEVEKAMAMYQLGKVAAESGEFLAEGEQMLEPLLTEDAYQHPNWVKFRLAQVYYHQNELVKAKQTVNNIDWGEDKNLKKRVKKLKKVLKG